MVASSKKTDSYSTLTKRSKIGQRRKRVYSGNERSLSFSEKSIDRNPERLVRINDSGGARF